METTELDTIDGRVYLTGFMACGKTAVGSALAARLGAPFVDLDHEIESRAGITIREIFDYAGEDKFRDLEHRALGDTRETPAAVIATGGGTFVSERNRKLIRELGVSVWIDATFDEIVGRLSDHGRRKRPLFQNEQQARRLYDERLAWYRLADLRVEVEAEDTARKVAGRIARLLARDTLCAT